MAQTISIIVTASPDNRERSESCLSRCEELAGSTETHIDHVFFYFDGVYQAQQNAPLHDQWISFSERNHVPLIACSTLAEARHIQASQNNGFELAGLSEFYSRLHNCQQVVQV